jgi:hypothetical protein
VSATCALPRHASEAHAKHFGPFTKMNPYIGNKNTKEIFKKLGNHFMKMVRKINWPYTLFQASHCDGYKEDNTSVYTVGHNTLHIFKFQT